MGAREPLGHLQRYLIEEQVEEYREARLGRRELVRRVLGITGSVSAAAGVLLQLGCGSGGPATAAATSAAGAGSATGGATAEATSARLLIGGAGGAAGGTASAGGAATAAATGQAGATGTSGAATAGPAELSVAADDPAVAAEDVEFPGQAGALTGYRAMPKGASKAPGILVIHENRGLTAHIKDCARRYAKAGYLALAVDLLSREGGTAAVAPGDTPAILGRAKPGDLVQDLASGLAYLKGLPAFAGPKAGAVGYCFGGGLTWLLAINSPDIAAVVPYYGPPPQPLDDVQKIAGAVLAFYGQLDTRITSNLPAIQAAMQKYGKVFESTVYPGANHAFNNDTGPTYNGAAAKDAFARSLGWFGQYTKGT